MPPLTHVQPGDLITSELMNAVIDALRKLDEKVEKCCERAQKPGPEPPKEKTFIDRVQPDTAFYGEMVDIVGGGFIPSEERNVVLIGEKRVVQFGTVTRELIQAVVPTLAFKQLSPVAVVVKNANGADSAKMKVGPEQTPDVVFVPTPPKVVEEMLTLAKVNKADVVYDLGSGDGRIVIRAAEKPFFAKGVGVEIDPVRIKEATEAVNNAKVGDRVKIVRGDAFNTDLSEASVIAIHLLPELNLKLRPRLLKLKPGTRIVSHAFDMGSWKPTAHSNANGADVYLWVVPKS